VTLGIVIPWRSGDPHRQRALDWVSRRYEHAFPDADVRLGGCDPSVPFNRAEAILDGATRSDADVLVIADGDCWCDTIRQAVDTVAAGEASWAIPHQLVHRLSPESSETVLTNPGIDWRSLPLSTDNRQDRHPYVGNQAGTLLVIERSVLFDVPPDVRFVGWAREDSAWAHALNLLVGPPWRGGGDLMHLWHQPQPRASRIKGSPASEALYRRYVTARRNPTGMRALIDESRRLHA
jgi:hypothetical protein